MPTKSRTQTSPKPASGSAKAKKTASTATRPVTTRGSGTSAPPKHTGQPKRTLTPDNFIQTVANVANSGPQLVLAAVKPNATALREKIFLGVSSVNDCRYCKWGHTHWAMAQGVPLEEVNQILSFQIESLEAKNLAEAAAILFAQHYAEHLDQFDHESIANLREYFSDSPGRRDSRLRALYHVHQPARQHRRCLPQP